MENCLCPQQIRYVERKLIFAIESIEILFAAESFIALSVKGINFVEFIEMLTVSKILDKDLLLVIERFLKFVKLFTLFFKHNLLKGPVLRKPIFRCVCPNFEATLIVFP